ncbi:MAG: PaaI family thioesterase [Microvirga sp.]
MVATVPTHGGEAGRVIPSIPKDPAFEARIRASFARQGLMGTLGASLLRVAPGAVDIALSPGPAVSQQHGFVHAGAVAAIADTAAGYAALTLMPPGAGVLTTEFKINLVAPASGDRILARGRIVRAGRTLTLAQTDVFSETAGEEKLVALLTATLMTIEGRDAVSD